LFCEYLETIFYTCPSDFSEIHGLWAKFVTPPKHDHSRKVDIFPHVAQKNQKLFEHPEGMSNRSNLRAGGKLGEVDKVMVHDRHT
jgi:hypothetical protein